MDGTEDNVSGSVLQRGVCLIDLLDKVNATLDTQILTGASLQVLQQVQVWMTGRRMQKRRIRFIT